MSKLDVTPEMIKNARERLNRLFHSEGILEKTAFVPMDQNGSTPQGGGAPPAQQGGPPPAAAPQGGPPPTDPAAGMPDGGSPGVGAPGGGGVVQLNANDLMSFMQQMMQQQGGGAPPAGGDPAAAGGAPGAAKPKGKGGDIAELKAMVTQMCDKLNVLLGWFAGMQGKDPNEAIQSTGGGPVEQSLLGGTLGGGEGAEAPPAMGQPSADPGGASPQVPGGQVPGGEPPGMQVQAAEGHRTPVLKTASEGYRLHDLIKRLNKQ